MQEKQNKEKNKTKGWVGGGIFEESEGVRWDNNNSEKWHWALQIL